MLAVRVTPNGVRAASVASRCAVSHCDSSRKFSSSNARSANKSFKLVVVGGGAGGCSTATVFSNKLGPGKVAVIEPAETHFNQAFWTLVGGGLKPFEESGKPMASVLPKKAEWIKDSVASFDPDHNAVVTRSGDRIEYEYLVVAMGIQLNYHLVKGLPEAFEVPGVCSNYNRNYVMKTAQAIRDFKSGNAVFTFPNTPIKCAGAPQKIMYITEKTLRNEGRRDKAKVMYHTSLPVLFGVKKYADALWPLIKERGIDVTLRSNLIEVRPDTKEAVFQNLDAPDKPPTVVPFSMLHVTPPMSAPDVLAASKKLVDASGFLDVDKNTLQHKQYKNVFGVGDCTNVPTSRTASAVAGQLGHLRRNLTDCMDKKSLESKYDGYTSCPIITGPGECILAEFDFSTPPEPLETFPFNQAVPRRSMYFMKSNIVPLVYWQMLNGYWEGPGTIRKVLRLGMGR